MAVFDRFIYFVSSKRYTISFSVSFAFHENVPKKYTRSSESMSPSTSCSACLRRRLVPRQSAYSSDRSDRSDRAVR